MSTRLQQKIRTHSLVDTVSHGKRDSEMFITEPSPAHPSANPAFGKSVKRASLRSYLYRIV